MLKLGALPPEPPKLFVAGYKQLKCINSRRIGSRQIWCRRTLEICAKWPLFSNPLTYNYVSGFEKRGHLAQISIERYDPKLATNHNLVYFLITVLAQTTILYLPSGTRVMSVRVTVSSCEVSTFIH